MSEPASPGNVIERLIQGISKGQWLELDELYAEDAVVEYPFALPGAPARLARMVRGGGNLACGRPNKLNKTAGAHAECAERTAWGRRPYEPDRVMPA